MNASFRRRFMRNTIAVSRRRRSFNLAMKIERKKNNPPPDRGNVPVGAC